MNSSKSIERKRTGVVQAHRPQRFRYFLLARARLKIFHGVKANNEEPVEGHGEALSGGGEEKSIVTAKFGQRVLVTPEGRLPFHNILTD